MSPESLPVKLRQLRGAMSLAEAAQRSQIPEQRIRLYEEGMRQPYGKTLKRLAQAYGVPVSELLGDGVASPASRTPPARAVRQRRRRRRAVVQDGERSVEVPVEVTAGERVRIIIELIVRPAPGQSAETARPPATVSVRAETAVQDAPAPSLHIQPTQPAAPPPVARPPHVSTGPAIPRRQPAHGHAADGGRAGPADVRDPLAEFRRAYGEFRRSRRS